MRRIVIIIAALLVSAVGAQAAPQKAPHHPTHRRTASNACGAEQMADQRIIADAIDRNPAMGADMRRMANRMRTQCIRPSAEPLPIYFWE